MNLEFLLRLLAILQLVALGQNSHVQEAKQRIRAEVRSALGNQRHSPPPPHLYKHYHGSHWRDGQRVHRLHGHRNHWSGRRRSAERHHFTGWSTWSACGSDCVKRRERFCKIKRKCGHTKHLEEHKCWNCHLESTWHSSTHNESPRQQQQQQSIHHASNTPQAIIINAAAASGSPQQQLPTPNTVHVHHQIRVPVLQETIEGGHKHQHPHHYHQQVEESSAENDFYVVNARPKFKRQRKPILIDTDDYSDLVEEEHDDDLYDDEYYTQAASEIETVRAGGMRSQSRRPRKRQRVLGMRQRHLAPGDDGIDGDTFQYEDFDFDQNIGDGGGGLEALYNDSYEDNDYVEYSNSSLLPPSKEKATPDALIPRHRRIYSKWSRWTKCSPKCTTRRYKKCRLKEQCGREVLREIAYCYTEGSFCQQWLQAQVQKSPPYELRPVAAARRRDISDGTQSNAIVTDFIMNGKGYRGPEYTPLKLKCGIAPIRSNKRSMYNMLKIIGGKAARKGEWPWQVAIFNRFKEAFCGGTLIAPQWVLTAAHCVRKVLYVRIGEHNLDYEDGTELQLRVLKTFKHPNFDKKTVDSDVALLRLPKAMNATTWIGFSCLPRPYQPLPKNVDCTVIGWGKRRNRDVAGTSVLHQAEVPIIPMDNCRSVYHDYTITKNMFCAGHKRGRIDTCAGDSGGPLLCRDSTKPNHPWTIFGITSFGDGCAKRNKFGIYAKVPNYVDWVWSVVNCNGNCKLHQRSYNN